MKKRPIRKQDSKFQLHEVIKHRKIESLKTTTADSKITVQLSKKNYFIIFSVFALILCIFLIKIANIQISGHSDYRKQSIKNISNRKILFANRGLILDRNDKILAYNEDTDDRDYGIRKYSEENLFILGDVRYPKKDGNGNYYVSDIEGLYGIEKRFDNYLKGENGFFVNQNFAEKQKKLTHFVDEAKDGEDIQLTIDSVMQKSVYENIKKNANKFGFKSATAIIMDINTGEILVNADYVNKNINKIPDYGLYRSISGLFTPGSTVKPFFALAALEEDIISPQETVYSSGKLLLENKYDPENPSVFLDWKAHGLVNLREAIASSSNIYFYHIGGGYKNRKGLGIDKLFRYATLFGFGIPTNTDIAVEPTGVVPNPKWKQENFNDFWRVGDTYNTVIGQYNFLVTPLQIVRATAVLANGGFLVEPKILKLMETEKVKVVVEDKNLEIIKKGMRDSVIKGIGTAKRLNIDGLKIAAKTGTAQLGKNNEFINSTLIGFYPYDEPKYAFTVVFEKAIPTSNQTQVLATISAHDFFNSILEKAPEKLK